MRLPSLRHSTAASSMCAKDSRPRARLSSRPSSSYVIIACSADEILGQEPSVQIYIASSSSSPRFPVQYAPKRGAAQLQGPARPAQLGPSRLSGPSGARPAGGPHSLRRARPGCD